MREEGLTELLKRYVSLFGSSSSIPFLTNECNLFQHKEIEGIVPYRIRNRCAVIFGDPLCSKAHVSSLTEAFHEMCLEKRLIALYVLSSESVVKVLGVPGKGRFLEVGKEFFLTSESEPTKGRDGRGLRGKLKGASQAGLTFHEYLGGDEAFEKRLQGVSDAWLNQRRGPQIYTSSGELFTNRDHMRWFYAMSEGVIVGVLLLQGLPGQKGSIIRRVPILPDAPMGTSEYLVHSTWEQLKKEGFAFLSLGFSQTSTIGEMGGYPPLSRLFVRFVFKIATRFFHLDNRRQYWEKFQPESKSCYLLVGSPKFSLKVIWALMSTLNVHMTSHH